MDIKEKKIFESLPIKKLLAIAIYGEARGESELGKAAVACVIQNRANKSKKSITYEILKPSQFSCFLQKDPNFAKLLVLAKTEYETDPVFNQCLYVAGLVLDGKIGDITKGATHYYNPSMINEPYWADSMLKLSKIGNHQFYLED